MTGRADVDLPATSGKRGESSRVLRVFGLWLKNGRLIDAQKRLERTVKQLYDGHIEDEMLCTGMSARENRFLFFPFPGPLPGRATVFASFKFSHNFQIADRCPPI